MGADVHEVDKFCICGVVPDDIFTIGGTDKWGRKVENLYIGERVTVTWKRKWGGHDTGFSISGELKATFAVGGRTLIGEITVDGPYGKKTVSCPWSRNYITVELS
jgi:hypothetical protein